MGQKPQHLTSYLAPVEYRDEFRGVYRRGYQGLDLSSVLDLPTRPEAIMKGLTRLPKELLPPSLLSHLLLGELELAGEPARPPADLPAGKRIEVTLDAREGMVAAGWFLDWTLG